MVPRYPFLTTTSSPNKAVLFCYCEVAVEEDAQVNDQGGDNSNLDPKADDADVPDDWDQDTDDEEDETATWTASWHPR